MSATAMDSGAGLGSGGSQRVPVMPPMTPALSPSARATRVIQTRPQQPLSDLELRDRISWQEVLSPHFVFKYDEAWFPVRQAESILQELEEAYSLVFRFTHEAFTGRWTVYAADQRSTSPTGHTLRSHINCNDRSMCLLQTSSQHLYGDLVLLLTHAMRAHRFCKHYGQTPGWAALEDAFAIFLNERVSIQPEVFPFYSADADLIAHHLYSHYSNAGVTRNWSHLPGQRSIVDTVLAGAFFLYLGDTFSDDRIVEFSKLDGSVTPNEFREFFGATLDDLEHAWVAHLPVSRISVTREEQEAMVQHWERAIDSHWLP